MFYATCEIVGHQTAHKNTRSQRRRVQLDSCYVWEFVEAFLYGGFRGAGEKGNCRVCCGERFYVVLNKTG